MEEPSEKKNTSESFSSKSFFVLLCFFSLTSLVFSIFSIIAAQAQVQPTDTEIQFYRIDITLNEQGRSFVQLVTTFKKPEKQASFKILGRVENFIASSNAGPVNCNLDVSGITDIKCDMNLTEAQKELNMTFETNDFVKTLDNKLYFSGDLTPHMPVADISTTLKLPQGFLLVGEDISSSVLSYSKNASAHIVGDTIIIIWKLSSISATDSLKFEVLYEQVKAPPWFELRMRYFILMGAVFAVVLGFIVVRYLRKSEKLVLSVLDEYERKAMDIITNEGEVKQKKIVEMTNLSKAKVSRVIKSLAGRGLIEVERSGRTNRIRLSKKKLEA